MWSAAFSPEECELLSRALDRAWRQLSETGQNTDEAMAKAALSRGILQAAGRGERSVDALSAYAVAHLEDNKQEERQQAERGGN